MPNNIFLDIAILFGITVSIATIIRLLRQPFIVAYIIAGMVAGPLFLNFLHHDLRFFESFAKFGIVLLLFIVGLNLNINKIRQIGRISFTAGLLQLLLTAMIGWWILKLLHVNAISSLYLAISITFSSTIIIVKLLGDKKISETIYGRYTIGLLLVQDLFAVIILLLITFSPSAFLYAGEGMLLKLLAIVCLIFILAKTALPYLLHRAASSEEWLFLFTIAWCFGVAALIYWSGFSVEIGALIAGISLGSSPYHLEITSRMKPLRDFFLVLFFIILGSELTLARLDGALMPALLLSAFIIIGNPLILYTIYRLHSFTRRNSFLIATTAAQVSEFGFIILFAGQQIGLLRGHELAIFTLTALITICVSSYLISYNEKIYGLLAPFWRLFGRDRREQHEKRPTAYPVWVIGYHRIGWKICETLQARAIPFAVIDLNPEAMAKLKARNIPAFFGDIADVEFLRSLPLRQAKVIVSTVPEADPQLTLLQYVKGGKSQPFVIATLSHNAAMNEVYQAGADYIMMPHLLGGAWMAEFITKKTWNKKIFSALRKSQQQELELRQTANTR